MRAKLPAEELKQRRRQSARRWRLRHPEKAKQVDAAYEQRRGKAVSRTRYLRVTYGLTKEAFAMLLAGQGDCCAICRTSTPNSHGWCVDHDHKTGSIRGILCHSCNVGIGALRDDPDLLLAGFTYLREASDDS